MSIYDDIIRQNQARQDQGSQQIQQGLGTIRQGIADHTAEEEKKKAEAEKKALVPDILSKFLNHAISGRVDPEHAGIGAKMAMLGLAPHDIFDEPGAASGTASAQQGLSVSAPPPGPQAADPQEGISSNGGRRVATSVPVVAPTSMPPPGQEMTAPRAPAYESPVGTPASSRAAYGRAGVPPGMYVPPQQGQAPQGLSAPTATPTSALSKGVDLPMPPLPDSGFATAPPGRAPHQWTNEEFRQIAPLIPLLKGSADPAGERMDRLMLTLLSKQGEGAANRENKLQITDKTTGTKKDISKAHLDYMQQKLEQDASIAAGHMQTAIDVANIHAKQSDVNSLRISSDAADQRLMTQYDKEASSLLALKGKLETSLAKLAEDPSVKSDIDATQTQIDEVSKRARAMADRIEARIAGGNNKSGGSTTQTQGTTQPANPGAGGVKAPTAADLLQKLRGG